MRNSATLARLMELTRKCVPFTGDGGQVFVILPEPPGAVVPIRSPGFRNWLVYKAVSHYQILPTPNAFHAILTLMEALASQNPDGPRLSVFRRVGSRMDGVFPTRILLDLANSDSQYVEISPTGWKLVSGTQARFQTSPTALPLPHPDPTPTPTTGSPTPALQAPDSRSPIPTAPPPPLQPPTPNPRPPTPAPQAPDSRSPIPTAPPPPLQLPTPNPQPLTPAFQAPNPPFPVADPAPAPAALQPPTPNPQPLTPAFQAPNPPFPVADPAPAPAALQPPTPNPRPPTPALQAPDSRSPIPTAPPPPLQPPTPNPQPPTPAFQAPNPPFPVVDPAPAPAALQPPTPNPQPPTPALKPFLNLPTPADFLRVLAWLLAALRPTGPFPVLILQGPPGAGKTFAARILRSILDPSSCPLSPIPATARDLLNLARHHWILAFDHVSAISPPLVDALCSLSSGLGAPVQEAVRPGPHAPLQYYKRPVILTVTDRFTCPPALAERAFTITLPPLAPACRVPEMALIDAFHQAWPAILAALCNAVSTALARLPQMRLPNGKLADALSWAVAASPALTTAQGAVCTEAEMLAALDPPPPSHPIVEAVLTLIEQRRHWAGTATQLLNLLEPALSCHTPAGVSKQLKSSMLTLADHGIELKFRRLGGGARQIEIRDDPCDAWTNQNPPHASQDFHSYPEPAQSKEFNQ